MEPEQFTYWLRGFTELHEAPPTFEQWKMIKEHLETVFTKVTPAKPDAISPLNRDNDWCPTQRRLC